MKYNFFYPISIILTVLFSAVYTPLCAQEMKEGFGYLEKGEFAKAESFFEKILLQYPTNKTANICYARAMGLNNQPKPALEKFSEMMKTYPNDLEISLNYAEALLWNKDFATAKTFYQNLLKTYPDNFVANLGYANTLSNLKEYDAALHYINKALVISVKNPGALTSRKYIKLGFAFEKTQAKDYLAAEKMLDEIFLDFPDDKETYLNKANLYFASKQPKKAKALFNQFMRVYKDSVLVYNGLALVANMQDKNPKALRIAKQAYSRQSALQDTVLQRQTIERWVQALIWNGRYNEAKTTINDLKKKFPNQNWVLALEATILTYKGFFGKTVPLYQKILKNDSVSFDGNLGIANAYYAKGWVNTAKKSVAQTLVVFPKQNDAMDLKKKLQVLKSPSIEQRFSYNFDNGKNEAWNSHTQVIVPFSEKFKLLANYSYRRTKSSALATPAYASTENVLAGITFNIAPRIAIFAQSGIAKASATTKNYSSFVTRNSIKITSFRMQDIELGFMKEMQNFNTDLVLSKIGTDNYFVNYSLSTNFRLGWYTQYYYTIFSDENIRNLLFTSLYYFLVKKQNYSLKFGVNYQYMGFSKQLPLTYFSPKKYNAGEVFLDIFRDETTILPKHFFYHLNAAGGYQYIEDYDRQLTYRLQFEGGYKFSDRFLSNVYALHSNISTTTVGGFVYTEFGLRMRYLFLKKIK